MKMRLMTSNIWGDYFGNPVSTREHLLERVYERYLPDVLGLQECTRSWWNSRLLTNLQLRYAMIPAEEGGLRSYTPLFYNRDRFDLLHHERYLFHKELDASKGFTAGVFKDRMDNNTFAVFVTHFWWQPERKDEIIRRYNAMDMTAAMTRLGTEYSCPVFFMGDLNCKVGSLTWNYFNEHGWKTSFLCTDEYSSYSSNHHDPIINSDGTCHGSTTQEPKEDSIDHIGIPAGAVVYRQHAVIDRDALDASDHSPVFADVEIPEQD